MTENNVHAYRPAPIDLFRRADGETSLVTFYDMLCAEQKPGGSKTVFPIGKDGEGNAVFADICELPHLIVTGRTGSGKSVFTDTMISYLVQNNSPKELGLMLIDPKQVELDGFADLPHLVCPILTDLKDATRALDALRVEMERRYGLLSDACARNIDEYNRMDGAEPLARIVVVISELAELMMFDRENTEYPVALLCAKARASGIHIVLSTQRPSVDVLTGMIKANVPARVCFAVSTAVDSRVALGKTGAERLEGRGRLIFLSGSGRVAFAQGAYISGDEVKALCGYIARENPELRADGIDLEKRSSEPKATKRSDDGMIYDILKNRIEVGELALSTNLIQRYLKVGFNRAIALMEKMEALELVKKDPEKGSKRFITVSAEELEEWYSEVGAE